MTAVEYLALVDRAALEGASAKVKRDHAWGPILLEVAHKDFCHHRGDLVTVEERQRRKAESAAPAVTPAATPGKPAPLGVSAPGPERRIPTAEEILALAEACHAASVALGRAIPLVEKARRELWPMADDECEGNV
jgi:hypothetical protein